MKILKLKSVRILLMMLMVALLSLTAAACVGGGSDNTNQDTCTVTFNSNGGSSVSAITQNKGTQVARPADPSPGAALSGFEFEAWCHDAALQQPVTFPFTLDKNYTLHAKWTESGGYSITQATGFTTNGNALFIKVPNATVSFSFSEKITVSNGATWVLANDINGENAIVTKTISLSETGDKVVYIIVTGNLGFNTYTVTVRRRAIFAVTFDSNGGSAMAPQDVEEDSYAARPGAVQRTGYTFETWDFDFESTPITAPVVIAAEWAAKSYNITYKDVGGADFSGIHGEDYPTRHIYGTETVLDSPAKNGNYVFEGWFTENGGSGEPLPALTATGYTDDITLHAKWETGIAYLGETGTKKIISVKNVTELTTSGNIALNGWYMLSGKVSGGIGAVEGQAHIILADNCDWSASNIEVSEGNTLCIYAQSAGAEAGKLSLSGIMGGAYGPVGSYTFSGGKGGNSGTIVINGGQISAKGVGGGVGGSGGHGDRYAGIGGAGGNSGSITINGGTVSATVIGGGTGGTGGHTSGVETSGASGGTGGAGGIITINGGTVSATVIGGGTGGTGGTGWGYYYGTTGGSGGTGGIITINGGTIHATRIGGGSGGTGGTGSIGGGMTGTDGNVGTIVILSGSIPSKIGGNASNGDTEVFLVVVETDEINKTVNSYLIPGAEYYNLADAKTDGEGKLYLWLPVDAAQTTINGTVYYRPVINKNMIDAGTVSEINRMVAAGKEITLASTTNAGYTFVGWYEEDTLVSDKASFNYTMPDRIATLTAVWAEYVFALEKNIAEAGNTGGDAGSFTAGSGLVFQASTNFGYTFIGWFEGEELISAAAELYYTMPHRNVTLTVVWVRGVSYIDESGGNQIYEGEYAELSTATSQTLTGWYVLAKTVSGYFTLTVSGEAHIILTDNYTLGVNSGSGYIGGVVVKPGSTLYVYAQSTGSQKGHLRVDTVIGGGTGNTGGDAGKIVINGGKITAAQIGGDYGVGKAGNGGEVVINSGEVIVSGSIGGGNSGGLGYAGGTGGIITINGGTVNASKIGGGNGGSSSNETSGNGGNGGSGGIITINGGTVNASKIGGGNGGSSGRFNSSFGGNGGNGGTILINGGKITATYVGGGDGGNGYGSYYYSSGGNGGNGADLIINGSTVIATYVGGGDGGGRGSSNPSSVEGAGGNGGTLTISGGTVNITKISGGKGGDGDQDGTGGELGAGATIVIVGGSINTNILGNPANGAANGNKSVVLVIIQTAAINTAVETGLVAGAGYYNFNSVKTDENGKIYLWLPADVSEVMINGVVYPVAP